MTPENIFIILISILKEDLIRQYIHKTRIKLPFKVKTQKELLEVKKEIQEYLKIKIL